MIIRETVTSARTQTWWLWCVVCVCEPKALFRCSVVIARSVCAKFIMSEKRSRPRPRRRSDLQDRQQDLLLTWSDGKLSMSEESFVGVRYQ